MKRLLPCLLSLTLIAGCTSGGTATTTPTAEHPADEVVVVMGPTSEPEAGFDPAFGWGAGEHVHEPLIQSTLTVTNADLTIGYDLATGMEVSDDGLTWTVTIRDDVSFTDGEPLTAEDVAFTYNTVKATSSVNDFTMLDSAEAVDDTTVLFHMTTPYSIWPYTMAIVGIVPEHAYDSATYGSNPIGSGRYTLVQWDRGEQIILEANPDYYGEAPKMKKVTIYTDGACSGNPGPGGWGAILSYNGHTKELSGGDPATTNNRMELMGAISALEALTEPCEVELYSDSKYLVDSVTKGWLSSWVKQGFLRKGKTVPNTDLWKRLLVLLDRHQVSFIWVKGHAENEFNNRCDELAVAQWKSIRSSL